MSKWCGVCRYVFLNGVLGLGENDSPLLNKCSSSDVRDMLLRLCTVRVVVEFLGGLGIKNGLVAVAWWVPEQVLGIPLLSSPFLCVRVTHHGVE